MKFLYYAIGGGMGHLSRASAFRHSLKIPREQFHVIHASLYGSMILKPQGISDTYIPNHLESNIELMQKLLRNLLAQTPLSRIYMDTFPYGILGEWKGVFKQFPDIPKYYVARRLRWEHYRDLVPPQKVIFEKTYRLEELSSPQQDFVRQCSLEEEYLSLSYPESLPPPFLKSLIAQLRAEQKEIWLIVHSSPLEEVRELYQFALASAQFQKVEPQFWLISQAFLTPPPPELIQSPYYPAYSLFPQVDKIITGAGFNLMQQIQPFRSKHLAMPFKRYYDDQFVRLSNYRKAKPDSP